MAWWQPAYYTTNEELEKEIDRYFDITPEDEIAITWLAIFLWFKTRQSLIHYECKPEFLDTIKEAKTKIEFAYEKRLIKRGNGWDIFALKNFDWKDRFENDNTNVNTDVSDTLSLEQKKLIAQRFNG